jgi:hypothetical protein
LLFATTVAEWSLLLHHFADPELRLKWRVAIRCEDEKTKKLWEPYSSATICGKHFKLTDYKKTVGSLFAGRVLNTGTVPSIFDHLPVTPKKCDAAEKRRDRAQRREEQAASSPRSQTATCDHVDTSGAQLRQEDDVFILFDSGKQKEMKDEEETKTRMTAAHERHDTVWDNNNYLTNCLKNSNGYAVHKGYKCGRCDCTVNTLQRLAYHLKLTHGVDTGFKCRYCSYTHFLKSGVNKHAAKEHLDEFTCKLCHLWTSGKKALEKHQLKDHAYLCGRCPTLSFTADSFKVHNNILHKIKKAKSVAGAILECPHCNYYTSFPRSFATHTAKTLRCGKCDFKTCQGLEMHLKVNHLQFYKCMHCKFSAEYQLELVMHMNLALKCDHCYFKCCLSTELFAHVAQNHVESRDVVHQTSVQGINPVANGPMIRQYQCGHCNYRAADLPLVQCHLTAVHKIKTFAKIKYKCEGCDFVSVVEDETKRHVRKAHYGYNDEIIIGDVSEQLQQQLVSDNDNAKRGEADIGVETIQEAMMASDEIDIKEEMDWVTSLSCSEEPDCILPD